MFVPTDRLPPILSDLIAHGRASGPGRPWLGVTTHEANGEILVGRVTPGGPAERAGAEAGEMITSVGGERPKNLADFYRKVWATGAAGAVVPLDLKRNEASRRVEVRSMNRLDHLKLRSSL
jgi:S1-C subfamily serine protease